MKGQKGKLDLPRLVKWTLERLKEHQFRLILDEDGDPLRLHLGKQYTEHLSQELLETYFSESLPPDKKEALFSLKEDMTPEKVMCVLPLFDSDPEFLKLAEDLLTTDIPTGSDQSDSDIEPEHADDESEVPGQHGKWYLLLLHLYLRREYLAMVAGQSLVGQRESLGSTETRDLENVLKYKLPGQLDTETALFYLGEIARRFRGIVKRASSLDILPASRDVPHEILVIMEEASKCYIYGHYIACLILCRGVMEAAIEDRLVQAGYGNKDFQTKEKNKLEGMIDFARTGGILENYLHSRAHDLRKLANDAVHAKIPLGDKGEWDKKCKEAYLHAREILEHLYGNDASEVGG